MWMLSRRTWSITLEGTSKSPASHALCIAGCRAESRGAFAARTRKTAENLADRHRQDRNRRTAIDVIEFMDLARALRIDARDVLSQLMPLYAQSGEFRGFFRETLSPFT